MKEKPDQVIARLCFALRPLRVIGGDSIMEKGKKGNEMFVLIQGEVEVKNGSHSLGYLNPVRFLLTFPSLPPHVPLRLW